MTSSPKSGSGRVAVGTNTHPQKTTKKQAILVYSGLKKPGPPAPKSQKSAEFAVSGLGIDDLMSENRRKMSENRSKSDQKVHGMYSDGSGSGSGSDSGWSSSDEDDGGGSVAATATATARDGYSDTRGWFTLAVAVAVAAWHCH
jgi:hypothetical protein